MELNDSEHCNEAWRKIKRIVIKRIPKKFNDVVLENFCTALLFFPIVSNLVLINFNCDLLFPILIAVLLF